MLPGPANPAWIQSMGYRLVGMIQVPSPSGSLGGNPNSNGLLSGPSSPSTSSTLTPGPQVTPGTSGSTIGNLSESNPSSSPVTSTTVPRPHSVLRFGTPPGQVGVPPAQLGAAAVPGPNFGLESSGTGATRMS